MSAPYYQHNYLGEFATPALATANVVLRGWDGRFLTMQAGGYTPCVPGDIGKTVTGSLSGDTGTLVDYDNTTRVWTLLPGADFQGGDVCSITPLGTGAGTVSSLAPSPYPGMYYYDTAYSAFMTWDGDEWASSSGLLRVSILPTATSDLAGAIALLEGGPGVADAVYICLKNSSDTYAWVKWRDGDGGEFVSKVTGV